MSKFFRFKHIPLFLLMGYLVFTSSCTESVIYQKHKEIPDFSWKYDYKLPFNFIIKNTETKYNTYFNLRTCSYYPYSNIWIQVKKFDKSGEMISEKKYEFILADIDGRWFGQGLGDIVDNKILLESNVSFESSGEYTYYFNHEMRSSDLIGVMDIGFSIEKSGK